MINLRIEELDNILYDLQNEYINEVEDCKEEDLYLLQLFSEKLLDKIKDCSYNYFEELVKNYIDCEIEDKELDIEETGSYEGVEEDIAFLKSLNYEDIKKIARKIELDNDCQDATNESLNWYTYHYKKEVD